MPSNLFIGESGQIISTTISFTMLLMMFAMALRLYFSRKRHTYFLLSVTLLLFVLNMASIIHRFLQPSFYLPTVMYVQYSVYVIGVQLLLLCFYQLYNASNFKQVRLLYGFIGVSILIISTQIFIQPIANVENRVLQIYFLATLVFMLIWMPPQVGQSIKYRIGLFAFSVAQAASILFDQNHFLFPLASYLQPLGIFMLFLILFERVVELLQNISLSSIKDPLTGLYNRRYFDSKVKQFLERGQMISVMFSDIDNFKKLNDTQGHDMGDKILKQVANILQEECERIGIAGRYGGEEMVVLITDQRTDMRKFAEIVRERVHTETIVTVSIGYCESEPGISAEELIKRADECMYMAKKTGKNKVVKYSA